MTALWLAVLLGMILTGIAVIRLARAREDYRELRRQARPPAPDDDPEFLALVQAMLDAEDGRP